MTDPRPPATAEVARGSITRRQGLIGLALLGSAGLVAACTSSSSPDVPTPSASQVGPADDVIADEQALMDLYDQTMASFPSLTTALAPLREQHAQHIEALAGTAPQASSALSAAPSAGSSAAGADEALTALIAAERAAMRQRVDACVAATTPGLARTLAFIAASEGSHIPALKDVRP